MKARGKLSRLEALEERERSRVAAVEAAKVDQRGRAADLMAPADRLTLDEWLAVAQAGGERWDHMQRVMTQAEGEHLPGSETAHAWDAALTDCPDGVPYPTPPAGAATQLRAEVDRAEAVAYLPGVDPDLGTAAAWVVAWWRYVAAVAQVIGEEVSA